MRHACPENAEGVAGYACLMFKAGRSGVLTSTPMLTALALVVGAVLGFEGGMGPDYEFERLARARGYLRIAGVDEVGRGPLAGPVTAAAVGSTFSARSEPGKVPKNSP